MTNSNNNKHRDGVKWFWVKYELERSCGRNYWLTYTTTAAEDEQLLKYGGWEKVTISSAVELAKDFDRRLTDWSRAGEDCYGTVYQLWVNIEHEQFDDRNKQWMPILPYVVDWPAKYKIRGSVVVKA